MIRKLIITMLSIGLGLNGVVFNTLKNSCVAIDPNKKKNLALDIIKQEFYKDLKKNSRNKMAKIFIDLDGTDELPNVFKVNNVENIIICVRNLWCHTKSLVPEFHIIRELIGELEEDFVNMFPSDKIVDVINALHDYYSKEDTGDNSAAENLLELFIDLGLGLDLIGDDCLNNINYLTTKEQSVKSLDIGILDTENRKISIFQDICKVYEEFNNNLKEFINSHKILNNSEKEELLNDLALIELLNENERKEYIKKNPDVDFIKYIISLDK